MKRYTKFVILIITICIFTNIQIRAHLSGNLLSGSEDIGWRQEYNFGYHVTGKYLHYEFHKYFMI